MLSSSVTIKKEIKSNPAKTVIYHFPVIEHKEEKEQKYKKNGEVKLTHSNAVNGVSSKTYAIKDEKILSEYIKYYADKRFDSIKDMRRYVLIMFELCTGLRVSDCIVRTWDDLMYNKNRYRDFIRVKQKKTAKYGEFFINELLCNVLDEYKNSLIKEYGYFNIESYLFPGGYKENTCITRQTAWNWCNIGAKEVGIKLSVGNHGLRKTFGYTSMNTHKDDAMFLATLMRIFGHTSERITLTYCGIDEDDNEKLYGDVSNFYSNLIDK